MMVDCLNDASGMVPLQHGRPSSDFDREVQKHLNRYEEQKREKKKVD
jgi:hypothetical protein